MKRAVLEIRDLQLVATEKKETLTLVKGLSCTLYAGRTTALIGESACGKSLTVMAILGLLPPGVQQVGGRMQLFVPPKDGPPNSPPTLWPLPEAKARGSHIGLIMQNPGGCFDPLYTIRSHFRETLRAHAIAKPGGTDAFLEPLLREVGLENPQRVLNAYPFQLSGGMLQRVMIALSLVPEPLVLLADEALSSLDVPGQRTLMALLRRLQAARGFAILFISHDIDCAARIADEVLIMHQGCVLESGLAGQVLNAPVSGYAQELVAAHTALEAAPRPAPNAALGEALSHGSVALSANAPKPAAPILPVLECRKLSKRYGTGGWLSSAAHLALDNISLSLAQGESLGLVGLNGSGKSTLIRLLLGLEKPDTGEVLLFGKTLDWHRQAAPQMWRRHIQVVFQDSRQAVNPRFSVEDIVTEALNVRGGQKRDICAELLTNVGLEADILHRRPMELSGGQLQRVCIARALALNPDILLLDESVSDLDLLTQARILELLDQLRRERGMALLFVSHDLRAVFQLCPQALVLDHGTLVGRINAENAEGAQGS